MGNPETKETCVACGNCGEHDSRAHYICTAAADRPRLIVATMERLQRETGKRPTLAETMAMFGVAKRRT